MPDLKTGEDGPTHADPQCLQLIQENFPPGIMVTLTPMGAGRNMAAHCSRIKTEPRSAFTVCYQAK